MPLTEDMPANPLNIYACQKYMGELYVRNFCSTFGLNAVCLRYFNVYGPRQSMEGAYKLVIGIFMEQKLNGEPLTINGDGTQTRDFTHVTDVVRANLLAAESPKVGKGEAINIGSGREYTMNQLADMFGGPRVYIPPRPYEEKFKRAGIQRAKELLGWEPRISLEEGIADLLR
jgi:UDP-glucose 4-epimerase